MKAAITIFVLWLGYGAAYCLVAGDVMPDPVDDEIYAVPKAIDQQLNDERLIGQILDKMQGDIPCGHVSLPMLYE